MSIFWYALYAILILAILVVEGLKVILLKAYLEG